MSAYISRVRYVEGLGSLIGSLRKRCGKGNSEDNHRQRWPRGQARPSYFSSYTLSESSAPDQDDQFAEEQAEDRLFMER